MDLEQTRTAANGMRRAALLFALVLFACSDPERAEPQDPPARATTDHRIPPDVGVELPEGAVVRFGQADERSATVVFTDDTRSLPELVAALGAGSMALSVVDRSGTESSRRVVRMEAADTRAVVERGAAEINRVRLTRLRVGRAFIGPSEPLEWRQVRRALRPVPRGVSVPACTEALSSACSGYSAAGGLDPLDCTLDYRGACVSGLEPEVARASLEDLETQLSLALRAHDQVASRAARAETEAQLRVVLLAAEAARARAGHQSVLIEQTIAEGHDPGVERAVIEGWFEAPAVPEIAGSPAP